MTPDVNVLVAASRADHPHHGVARDWLEAAVGSSETGAVLTLMPMVLASFLRLVTSPKIFQQATPIEDAVAFVDALLASPGVPACRLEPGVDQAAATLSRQATLWQRCAGCLGSGGCSPAW